MVRDRIRKAATDMRALRKSHGTQRNQVNAMCCTERALKKQIVETNALTKSSPAWRVKAIFRGCVIKLLQRRLHPLQHNELKTGGKYQAWLRQLY